MKKAKGGVAHKFGVLALVDRESRTMRTFTFDKLGGEQSCRSFAPTLPVKPA